MWPTVKWTRLPAGNNRRLPEYTSRATFPSMTLPGRKWASFKGVSGCTSMKKLGVGTGEWSLSAAAKETASQPATSAKKSG
jgi:hypothetical protein